MVFLLFSAATSFAKTPLQPILPLLEAMPSDLHVTVPYLLSFVMGILLSLLITLACAFFQLFCASFFQLYNLICLSQKFLVNFI
uniref:Uncharacterized protein n=1 Tax=Aegilops tauschii subsp. strangulata TaxID=200361 RepID=A0A452YDD1_AEGTS